LRQISLFSARTPLGELTAALQASGVPLPKTNSWQRLYDTDFVDICCQSSVVYIYICVVSLLGLYQQLQLVIGDWTTLSNRDYERL